MPTRHLFFLAGILGKESAVMCERCHTRAK
jgi:hypothetical protein